MTLRSATICGYAIGLVMTGWAVSSAVAAGSDEDDVKTCPKGQIWDTKSKKCVTEESGVVDDETRTAYAHALAKEGRYQEALDTLDALADPETATALNYRGYATRKLGRVDDGISYYHEAIKLDPNYARVREYLGEAYVIQARLDLAEEQLESIKGICGTDCEEYQELADAIRSAPRT